MRMLKCDPRAFARCPYRKQCSDSPEHTSFYAGTECDYFNQQVIKMMRSYRSSSVNSDPLIQTGTHAADARLSDTATPDTPEQRTGSSSQQKRRIPDGRK